MQKQLKALEEWRLREENKLRKVVQALIVGVVLIAIGAAGGIWRVQNLTEDNRRLTQNAARLARSNQDLIGRVDTLNRSQAEQVYSDCLERNQRAEASGAALAQLVDAHIKDGNKATASVWKKYLDAAKKNKLPDCVKPSSVPTK